MQDRDPAGEREGMAVAGERRGVPTAGTDYPPPNPYTGPTRRSFSTPSAFSATAPAGFSNFFVYFFYLICFRAIKINADPVRKKILREPTTARHPEPADDVYAVPRRGSVKFSVFFFSPRFPFFITCFTVPFCANASNTTRRPSDVRYVRLAVRYRIRVTVLRLHVNSAVFSFGGRGRICGNSRYFVF